MLTNNPNFIELKKMRIFFKSRQKYVVKWQSLKNLEIAIFNEEKISPYFADIRSEDNWDELRKLHCEKGRYNSY